MGPEMSDFAGMLEIQIPRLRRYARALTRDFSRADDLVQNCLARAVAKQHLWQYGTDLRAWLFTILHHQHVNDVRRSIREGSHVTLEELPALTAQPDAIAVLQLRDLEAALGMLQLEQRQVILLVGLEDLSYEQVGEHPQRARRYGTLAAVARSGPTAAADGYGGAGAPEDLD